MAENITRVMPRVNLNDEWAIDIYWFHLIKAILSATKFGEGPNGEVVEGVNGIYRIKCPWAYERHRIQAFNAWIRRVMDWDDPSYFSYQFGCDACRKAGYKEANWDELVDTVAMPFIERRLSKANEIEAETGWYRKKIEEGTSNITPLPVGRPRRKTPW